MAVSTDEPHLRVDEPSSDEPVSVDVSADPATGGRHSWTQRLLLSVNCLVIVACFVGAAGLLIGRHYRGELNTVDIITRGDGDGALADSPAGGVDPVAVDGSAPVETFPAADPEAQNFLITGADNNACVDPNSPTAASIGERSGERSDTIMVMRVDPSTNRAAILSFPRDLWVNIPGKGGKSRINSTYERDKPQRLIDTIYQNFGVPVDHFIQIDFCAFKTIVDAVGGVNVPFEAPARDRGSGLVVPAAGCVNLIGDNALSYVRSRHFEYQQPNGTWKEDPASDLGRISRQQDFIRRTLAAVLAQGVLSPSTATDLIDATIGNVVVDSGLSISAMLEFMGVMRNLEPASVNTYQIAAKRLITGNNDVLDPTIDNDHMRAVLAIFTGTASLTGAPDPTAPTTVVGGADPAASTLPGVTVPTSPPTVDTTPVAPEDSVIGFTPAKTQTCP